MLVTTEAIVLSKINYSETSLIVRCYTLSDGL
ncbi:MAG: recombination protein O N-terminal domain-containing protein, partial [Bacteroidota bacterium]|nr:recombination protein O N-terminal domain-containing protein [Bacteroidota bacterium]